MARPKKNILSPQIIAETALKLVDKGHDFTIPGIAAELGVNPSSLYHHVTGGRAEIIKLMRRALYEKIDLSGLTDPLLPWQDRLEQWVRSYRDSSALVPAALPLLVGAAVDDSLTLQIYEALFTILDQAGVGQEQQLAVAAMLDAIVIGSAIDAASPDPLWTATEELPRLTSLASPEAMTRRTQDGLTLAIRAAVAQIEAIAEAPRR
ncbi:TetR/AcrR family transcriptional regulator [Arthrobacter sp. Hor0625]|uniref:TetR/AcrR family transcriptional regulator n=1 Tax=Arthrobacter sp. Hor0625 TaxID=3457358 RepID=UPI00403E5DA9